MKRAEPTSITWSGQLLYDRAALENRNVRPYGFRGAPLGVIQDQRWANTTLSTDWVNNYDWQASQSLRITASAGILRSSVIAS